MLYRSAARLRQGDEIKIKASGEVVRIMFASNIQEPEARFLVLVAVKSRIEGYTVLTHHSIE